MNQIKLTDEEIQQVTINVSNGGSFVDCFRNCYNAVADAQLAKYREWLGSEELRKDVEDILINWYQGEIFRDEVIKQIISLVMGKQEGVG